MTLEDIAFWQAVLAGAIRLATPIALAALGETIVERGGTINLGIDGIMIGGAFTAIFVAGFGGWGAALLAAALVGAVFGVLIALSVLRGGANQIVAGIAVSLLAAGLATYFYQLWDGLGLSHAAVDLVPVIDIPALRDLAIVGPILSGQSLLTWATLAMVVVAVPMLRRSRPGLILKAVGDEPAAAALRGIDVIRVRTLALAIGGALAGLGGAAITIGYLGAYTDGLVAGRGYVALAVVIIGRWSPLGAIAGALVFALFDSLALQAQGGQLALPVEAYMALPYLMTLVVLVLTARGNLAPRALGAPYRPER
ncbi:Inner-membrane translocator [Mesorhizobium plurifarium]|uniref:Inner-membrane translocator n=1 Tax=Mesorhizobium plurifarium TaxID=69974 RepID=A0A0K2VQG1_MESPL|nr:Inner-membrane translocator [Mesorhizobium plurifarium]